MEWREQARCREVGTSAFFPEPADTKAARLAKQVCAECPVQAECLEEGIAEQHGIWGGLTPVERRNLRKRRKAVA